jgi:hypothetical protein
MPRRIADCLLPGRSSVWMRGRHAALRRYLQFASGAKRFQANIWGFQDVDTRHVLGPMIRVLRGIRRRCGMQFISRPAPTAGSSESCAASARPWVAATCYGVGDPDYNRAMGYAKLTHHAVRTGSLSVGWVQVLTVHVSPVGWLPDLKGGKFAWRHRKN